MSTKYKYKYIALACALALGSSSVWAASPFPSIPYYMQSQKINRTKPNLVLLLDNSGSMDNWDTQDLYNPNRRTQRYIAARQVALKVFNDYKDTFRWGVAFLNAQEEDNSRKGAEGTEFSNDYVPGYNFKGAGAGWYYNKQGKLVGYQNRVYDSDQSGYVAVPIDDVGDINGHIKPEQEKKIKQYISSIYPYGGTPTHRALRSVYNYMSASDYSFANNDYYNIPGNPNYFFSNRKKSYPDPSKDSGLVMQYRCQKNYVVLISDGDYNDGSGLYFQDPDNKTNSGYSSEKPWSMAYNKDYRPENYPFMMHDLDGQSWDDIYFPQQNIITHSIGFTHDSSKLREIATQSGGQYVSANNTKDLEQALSSILNAAAVETPDYVRYDKINFTNPMAVLSNNSSNSLIPIVTIDPDYWSSYIQFKQLNKTTSTGYQQYNNKDIIAYPITDTENNRTVLATIPSRNGALYDISRKSIDAMKGKDLKNEDFNLKQLYEDEGGDSSQKVLNKNKWQDGYIPWLTGWENKKDNQTANPWDSNPSYRDRTGQGTATNAADANMRRHLGDVTRVDLAMMGPNITKLVKPFKAHFTMPKFMVVQSNDGMVRIYSAASYDDDRPYWERFAYIPGNADRNGNANDKTNTSSKFLNDLIIRARQNYKQGGIDHEYFMSGSVNYYSTPAMAKKGPRYFFIGTLGQGGKAAYALNVGGRDDVSGNLTGIDANAANDTTENKYNPDDKTNVPLWDTSTTAFGAAGEGVHGLGYTISSAILGMVALSRDADGSVVPQSGKQYVTFLPNGYDYSGTKDNKPVIYAIDTLGYKYQFNNQNKTMEAVSTNGGKAGKVIQTIEIPAAAGAVLGSVSAVDYNGDNIIDALYVGDSNGNLYRVDLRKAGDETQQGESMQYTVATIFKGNSAHPITAAPTIAKVGNLRYVIFGTGRNYLAGDTITNETKPDDIAIQTIYSIRDTAANNGTTQPTITYADRDQYLFQRKLAIPANGNSLMRTVTAGSNNSGTNQPSPNYGWYMDLSIDGAKTGERVTVKPIVESIGSHATVFFNTETLSFKLPADANNLKCVGASASTTGWVYQLNAATGQIPTRVYAGKFLHNGIMYAGMSGGGDNMTYLTEAPSAQDTSGNALSSGPLTPPGNPPGNPPGGENVCKIQSGITSSPTEGVSLITKICDPATVKQISWREIPLEYHNKQ